MKRFGPRTWISPTLAVVQRQRCAVVLDQPEFHPAHRDADRSGARPAVRADAGVHQGLRHAVALDDAPAGRRGDPFVVVDRERGRAGDQQACPAEGLDEFGVVGEGLCDAVVHRRDAEHHGRAVVQLPCHALGAEAAQVSHRAAESQRAQDAEDQPVHMEQRQPVHEDVVAGPLPGVGERVQRRGDRPARDDGTLGRAGGAGGVDDEGGVLVAGETSGPATPAPRTSMSTRSKWRSAEGSSSPGAASTRVGALSVRMWPSSFSPDFGLSGTAATPARSAATTATAVSSELVAHTATRPAPAHRAARASAAAPSSA